MPLVDPGHDVPEQAGRVPVRHAGRVAGNARDPARVAHRAARLRGLRLVAHPRAGVEMAARRRLRLPGGDPHPGALHVPLQRELHRPAPDARRGRRRLPRPFRGCGTWRSWAVLAALGIAVGAGRRALQRARVAAVERVPYIQFWKKRRSSRRSRRSPASPLAIEVRDAPGLHPWDNSILDLLVSAKGDVRRAMPRLHGALQARRRGGLQGRALSPRRRRRASRIATASARACRWSSTRRERCASRPIATPARRCASTEPASPPGASPRSTGIASSARRCCRARSTRVTPER